MRLSSPQETTTQEQLMDTQTEMRAMEARFGQEMADAEIAREALEAELQYMTESGLALEQRIASELRAKAGLQEQLRLCEAADVIHEIIHTLECEQARATHEEALRVESQARADESDQSAAKIRQIAAVAKIQCEFRHLRARASSRLLRKSYQDRLQGLEESLVAQSTSQLAAQSDAAAAVQQSLQAELASAAESGAASEARVEQLHSELAETRVAHEESMAEAEVSLREQVSSEASLVAERMAAEQDAAAAAAALEIEAARATTQTQLDQHTASSAAYEAALQGELDVAIESGEALQQELQVAVSRIQVTESALRTAEEAYELLQKESERRLLQSEEMLSDLSTRAGSPLKSTPLAAAVQEEERSRAEEQRAEMEEQLERERERRLAAEREKAELLQASEQARRSVSLASPLPKSAGPPPSPVESPQQRDKEAEPDDGSSSRSKSPLLSFRLVPKGTPQSGVRRKLHNGTTTPDLSSSLHTHTLPPHTAVQQATECAVFAQPRLTEKTRQISCARGGPRPSLRPRGTANWLPLRLKKGLGRRRRRWPERSKP